MQNYLRTKWGEKMLYLFNKYKKLCHKVDLWRYCILYDTGGVYMDADCILINKFDFLKVAVDEPNNNKKFSHNWTDFYKIENEDEE